MTETEKIYKHTYFMIGETLVEESKQHITPEKACDQIREYLKEMIWKLNKEREQKMMANICGDDRFKVISKAKAALIEGTNIETSAKEMEVLDNFLFRCWQMGWLDKYKEGE